MFDFDGPPDRSGTHALKHDEHLGQDVIAMWIADMDFRSAPPVVDALDERIRHGVFGYTLPWEALGQRVVEWVGRRHGWAVQTDWIVWLPGVVPGFNAACRAFCTDGQAVAVPTPGYPPLLEAPGLHGARRLEVATVVRGGRWTIDLNSLEHQLKRSDCALLLLCNPMNPCGSLLTKQELDAVVGLCRHYGVTLCSDEIHCDLTLDPDTRHIPAGSLDPGTITLMSASKTFNFPGLNCAFAVIPNRPVRERFIRAMDGLVSWPGLMGYLATEAAFGLGGAWRRALLDYLRANRDELVRRVNAIEGLEIIPPQATFLAWIDASGLGADPYQKFLEAGVAPSPGRDFGAPGFVRLNFGCSRGLLDAALGRLERAFGA